MAKKKRIAIVGTHGVPAKYGGFETLADFLCQYMGSDYDITVYCNANKYPVRKKVNVLVIAQTNFYIVLVCK